MTDRTPPDEQHLKLWQKVRQLELQIERLQHDMAVLKSGASQNAAGEQAAEIPLFKPEDFLRSTDVPPAVQAASTVSSAAAASEYGDVFARAADGDALPFPDLSPSSVPAAKTAAVPPPLPPQATPQAAPYTAAPIPRPIPATPRPPRPPKTAATDPLWQWLLRGNPLLKVGMVVLFLGLAFLLRLAAEHIYVPIGLRYVTVGAAGAGLAALGWVLRDKKPDYALLMQGFGVAVMYLTTLAALKLHPLLPAPFALVLMVLCVGVMIYLALKQDSLPMAQAALIGGLAAPILVSDGSGQYVVLFSYLLLLNLGVGVIALFKPWRALNLTAFIGTVLIAAVWGASAYTPAHLSTTEPFLLAHWLLYIALAWLFAYRTAEAGLPEEAMPADNAPTWAQLWANLGERLRRIGILDSMLVFGAALSGFALQYGMVRHGDKLPAVAAVVAAAVYGIAAYAVSRSKKYDLSLLAQAFALLSLVFVTLSIPLYFEGEWTAAAWALEAVLVYAFAGKTRLPLSRLLALIVLLLAWPAHWSSLRLGGETVLTGSLFGTVLYALSGMVIFALWWRNGGEAEHARWENKLVGMALALGLLHVLFIPLLLLAHDAAIPAMAALAAGFAAVQYRHRQAVVSVMVGVALLLSCLLLLFSGGKGYEWRLIAGILWLAAAFGLHRALWQTNADKKDDATWLNSVIGWLALIAGFALVFNALSWWAEMRQLAWKSTEPLWLSAILFALMWLSAAVLNWRQAAVWCRVFLPLTALFVFNHMALDFPYHEAWEWTAVLSLALAVHFLVLRQDFRQPDSVEPLWHGGGFYVFAAAFSWLFGHLLAQHAAAGSVWQILAWVLTPLVLLTLLTAWRGSGYGEDWPPRVLYTEYGGGMLLMLLLLWVVWRNIATPGTLGAWPYLPVLNPLELTMLAVLALAAWWWRGNELFNADGSGHRTALMVWLGVIFLTISAGVMRAWHYYDGIGWRIDELLASFGLQASLSVVWTLTAIVLMVGARRRGRGLWYVGAALLALVVAKLFLVELGNSGGIARIVSFIAVGVLLLLVAYFAPLPPAEDDESNE
ncbi:MAG: DUF2339 domain-containing protein [Neisseria sp.]|nr:DUF2339 domain-containing protein [Neisseria sp.]